jgi:hypothetical protein
MTAGKKTAKSRLRCMRCIRKYPVNTGTMTKGTAQFPCTAPALSDDDVAPVRELSHWGLVTEAGVEPPWASSL